ncbi:MAG: multiple sugar transport system permease protein [Verrucomicrobiota bacterium]|nr:multiple sugar transport system permease protein [Verrucomicrobiota bacterium]MEA3205812.1 multiple sugar transport system permease protein [Verrucomicrobiota bacterium]
MKAGHREALWGFLFILPTYLGFAIFILGPVVAVAGMSFTKFDVLTGAEFTGLTNYVRLLSDERLRNVYTNTFVFTIFAVFFNVSIGLALAVLLNRRLPRLLRNFFRSVYFFPLLIAHTYVAVIWQFLYQRDTGVINYYLSLLGIAPISWLGSAAWVLPSVIIMDVWKNTGFAMIIFLAGLQNIPKDYYEAARLDGAKAVQLFLRITFPLLSPTIFFVLVIFMIGAIQVFDTIIVLTGGGPGDASKSVVIYIYEQAFQNFDLGYASTVAMTLFVIILIFTLLQFWFSRRWVHYE